MSNPGPLSPPRLLTRRRALKLLTVGTAASLVDGFIIEPRTLSITRQSLGSSGQLSSLAGLKIAHLTDFHFRPDHDHALIASAVNATNQENPDIIALTGDFISRDPAVIPPLLEHLAYLTPRLGTFAVMGNHDGWSGDASKIRRQFEKAGIHFLINQHSRLTLRGQSFAVAGTDFVWRGSPDPAKTFRGLPADVPSIALVHEPDFFDTMATHRPGLLQLSGHTHGGQCRVPLLGYAPHTVAMGRNYIHGPFSKHRSHLFVSRGVGTVGIRVRFACPPELAVLSLTSPS